MAGPCKSSGLNCVGVRLQHPSRRPHTVRHRSRHGFTLVELLVVITIIGMLVSLLLPAIQAARETGRKNTCINNMRNASTALMQVHDSKRFYPGYANIVGNKRASWVVAILNQLDRGDLYQLWVNTLMTAPPAAMGALTTQVPWAHTQLNILVCPSNPSTGLSTNPLSYVVNSGSANTANDNLPGVVPNWNEDLNSGVFFNQARSDVNGGGLTNFMPAVSGATGSGSFLPSSAAPKVSMDFISTNDGTSYTVMMSENLQATNWATDPEDIATDRPHNPFKSEFHIRQNTAFVWFVTSNLNNAEPPSASAVYNVAGYKINQLGKSVATPIPYGAFNSAATPFPTGGLAYARPSSAHPGGVNVMFCDNHYRFIAEDIQYNVFTQLMTPRQNAVVLSLPSVSPAVTTKTNLWNYLINEADY
jgi:prepilin-type N-terminal cleavage/methylation domain-containing protein/prepilin-type processing-associated H-X9-DG protein